jgi:hypothetical protein
MQQSGNGATPQECREVSFHELCHAWLALGEEKSGRSEIFFLDLVLGLPMMSECAITELRLRRFWGCLYAAMVVESRLDAGV